MQSQCRATEYDLALNAKDSHFRDQEIFAYYTLWPRPETDDTGYPPWQWQTNRERQRALAYEGF